MRARASRMTVFVRRLFLCGPGSRQPEFVAFEYDAAKVGD